MTLTTIAMTTIASNIKLSDGRDGLLNEHFDANGQLRFIDGFFGGVAREGGHFSAADWDELGEKYPEIAAAKRESMEAKAMRLTSPRAAAEAADHGV